MGNIHSLSLLVDKRKSILKVIYIFVQVGKDGSLEISLKEVFSIVKGKLFFC